MIADCLTGITSLDLSFNSIGADGAPAIAASLTGLTSLDLSANSIGAAGAQAIAASLTGLTSLSLRGNSIGADGVRAVFDGSASRDSGRTPRLDLRGNGELSDLLPKEVLESADAQAILAAYRRFSAAAKAQDYDR